MNDKPLHVQRNIIYQPVRTERRVREARIKKLVSRRRSLKPLVGVMSEEELHREICREVGLEFAEKLMEFNKVFIRRRTDGVVEWWAELEVIVPEGKPGE